MNFLWRKLKMGLDHLLEVEDFPLKVRIAEEKVGVATEEKSKSVETKIPDQNVMIKEIVARILGVDHQVEQGLEEEMRAFVPEKQNLDYVKNILKKMNYWRTCASIHTFLRNFRSCEKVILILWVISAGGLGLYKIFSLLFCHLCLFCGVF
jgi:hypothetical protein